MFISTLQQIEIFVFQFIVSVLSHQGGINDQLRSLHGPNSEIFQLLRSYIAAFCKLSYSTCSLRLNFTLLIRIIVKQKQKKKKHLYFLRVSTFFSFASSFSTSPTLSPVRKRGFLPNVNCAMEQYKPSTPSYIRGRKMYVFRWNLLNLRKQSSKRHTNEYFFEGFILFRKAPSLAFIFFFFNTFFAKHKQKKRPVTK